MRAKVLRYRPPVLAMLGVGAYRTAFNQPKATVGRQEDRMGDTVLWVLPNPSGLNANYQALDLAEFFSELRAFSESSYSVAAETSKGRIRRALTNTTATNHVLLCFTPANHLHNG